MATLPQELLQRILARVGTADATYATSSLSARHWLPEQRVEFALAWADGCADLALLGAVKAGWHEEAELLCDQHGADVRAYDDAALDLAVRRGLADVCRIIVVRHPMIVDFRNHPKMSAESTNTIHSLIHRLKLAVNNGYASVCDVILQTRPFAASRREVIVGELDKLLISAADHGQTDVCRSLLDVPVNTPRANAHSCEALMRAAKKGYMDICRLLLDAPNDAARADARNSKALHFAVELGNIDMCRLLLGRDSHPARPSKKAYMLAIIQGHADIFKLIMSSFKTAPRLLNKIHLETAASTGNVEICALVLQVMKRRYKPRQFGDVVKEAFSAAVGNGHEDVCMMLMQHGARPKPHHMLDALDKNMSKMFIRTIAEAPDIYEPLSSDDLSDNAQIAFDEESEEDVFANME
jgi:ankyrin repeat protein